MSNNFNVGDWVQVAQDATYTLNDQGTTYRSSCGGLVVKVEDGPDREGDYFLRSSQGIPGHASPQFLTLVAEPTPPTQTITDLALVQSGDIVTVNLTSYKGPFTGPVYEFCGRVYFGEYVLRNIYGDSGVNVEFISAQRPVTPLPSEDDAVIKIFDTTFKSYPGGVLAVRKSDAAYVWFTLAGHYGPYKDEEITEWAPVTISEGKRVQA